MEPLYPAVRVQLVGQDGNVFAIIGRVSGALKRAKLHDAARDYCRECMAAHSYDQVLQITIRYVEVS